MTDPNATRVPLPRLARPGTPPVESEVSPALAQFELRQLWFEPLTNSFVVTGQTPVEVVRFAISRAAVNSVGWDASMLEVFRRLSAGERNFGIAPGATGMVSWRMREGVAEPPKRA
jgi:hypothetical protein